ncbi:hypothetical protein MUO98_05015 [Candidatus Bathyarchaeota archaeon]|nr:hypothetical protein [Candidatus Bathyarchaeota archaeon]
MASMIWLGNLYPSQEKVKAHNPDVDRNNGTTWNLDEDIKGNHTKAFIAKGNIIEGVEAKT